MHEKRDTELPEFYDLEPGDMIGCSKSGRIGKFVERFKRPSRHLFARVVADSGKTFLIAKTNVVTPEEAREAKPLRMSRPVLKPQMKRPPKRSALPDPSVYDRAGTNIFVQLEPGQEIGCIRTGRVGRYLEDVSSCVARAETVSGHTFRIHKSDIVTLQEALASEAYPKTAVDLACVGGDVTNASFDQDWQPPNGEPDPTTVPPGPAKVLVMIARVQAGQELWSDDDQL